MAEAPRTSKAMNRKKRPVGRAMQMRADMNSFNPTSDPGIVCLCKDGQISELSLEQVLLQATELADLAHASPLENAAVLCLLEAVLYDCWNPGSKDDFEEHWKAMWKARRFPEEVIRRYFEEHRHLFNLFDDDRPFYQTPHLEVDRTDPVARLLTEAATGNNATLFSHRNDDIPDAMAPAEAFRAILVGQSFALGFGKAATARIAGKIFPRPYSADAILLRGVTIWLSSDNLFETLMLNYTPYERKADDLPEWKVEPPYALMDHIDGKERQSVPAHGHMDLLTWQSRLTRLIPEKDEQGHITVKHVYFTQGRSADKRELHPMKSYRRDAKEGLQPIALSAGKAAWRDAHTLLHVRGTSLDTIPAASLLFASEMAQFGPLRNRPPLGVNIVGLATEPNKAG